MFLGYKRAGKLNDKKITGEGKISGWLICDGGFDSDIAIDLYAAPEFLVRFEFVDVFKKGAWVDVFKRFDFHHTFAA